MPLWVQITIIISLIFLILISAIFSALETSYSSISIAKLDHSLPKNSLTRKLVKKHYSQFGRTLSTILLGNNLINIAASALLSMFLGKAINDEGLTVLITMLIMTPIVVVFGEIIPKIFARKYPIQYIKKVFWIMEFFYIIFLPFTYLIAKIFKPEDITNTEKDLRAFIKIGHKEGVLEKNEALLAINALDLDSVKVSKHYTKIKDVDYVEYDWDLDKVKDKFLETGYSRLPIKKKNLFIGIIILKNIWKETKGKAEDYLVEVPNISYNILLTKAMEKMRIEKAQFAFVVRNSTARIPIGIITFEDIIEELVGEIYDENDDEVEIYVISLQHAIVHSTTKISKINSELSFKLPEEHLTIGEWLKKISKKDINMKFKFKYKKYSFKVIENKRNSVAKIEIYQK